MTTTTTSHGTYTHGTPQRTESGWTRVDQWEASEDGGGMTAADLFHCTGRDDDTPRHDIGRGYVSTCSWCWLGYGHTEAEHARSVTAS